MKWASCKNFRAEFIFYNHHLDCNETANRPKLQSFEFEQALRKQDTIELLMTAFCQILCLYSWRNNTISTKLQKIYILFTIACNYLGVLFQWLVYHIPPLLIPLGLVDSALLFLKGRSKEKNVFQLSVICFWQGPF